MTLTSKMLLLLSLFLGVLLLPRAAAADGTCQPPAKLEGQQALVFYLGGIPDSDATPHIQVMIEADGSARAHGLTKLRDITDGTSNTIFLVVSAPVNISCGDVNGDGFAGVNALSLTARNARTGVLVPLTFVPVDGELDTLEQVIIVVGGKTFVETVGPFYSWVVEVRP